MCNTKMFSFVVLVFATSLSLCPPAVATPMTEDDASLYGINLYGNRTSSDDSVGSVPLAVCRIGAKLANHSSGQNQPQAENTLLPMCLQATNGATLTSLLSKLRDSDAASGLTLGSITGIASGSGGITAVVGAFCGGSQSCFAANTPVSTVPEPGTSALLATGLIGLVGLARCGSYRRIIRYCGHKDSVTAERAVIG